MAVATVLHLGHDPCLRIPVMEFSGLFVVRTACSAVSVQEALAAQSVAGIIFEADAGSRFDHVVPVARSLSAAPLVLFQDRFTDAYKGLFDFVVPVQTPPDAWLESLQELVLRFQKLREASLRLRAECADARSLSEALRRRSASLRESPLDLHALWR